MKDIKVFKAYAVGAVTGLVLSSTAWAQQSDLEVTMQVVPANASANAATGEITLPDKASDRARDAAAFGLDTANMAREAKGDLGRDFGQEVSDRARQRDLGPNTPGRP